MIAMHLICRQCLTVLSNELRLVSFTGPGDGMGQDFLPRGTLMQEDGSYFHGRQDAYIAHLEDVINTHLTIDSKRLNGCCGLDGCDGANLQCDGCGSYVAVKMTDCWTPHCIIFEGDATEAISEQLTAHEN